MNTKLFLSTFALIFLAELGDKTQLAAMARSAGAEGGRWTVFLSASAALVLSTLLAVFVGTALTKVIPENAIKVGSAVLFIVFGCLILGDVLFPGRLALATGRPGIMSHVALRIAAEFEQAAADDYRRLAERAEEPALRALMLSLADEEARHANKIRHAEIEFDKVALKSVREDQLPAMESLSHDVAQHEQPLLEHAIDHEQATADFYESLARGSALPGLKQTFLALAADEREHMALLKAVVVGQAQA